MIPVETYCFCKCPLCGEEFHEWIELYAPCIVTAECWCPSCEMIVGARVIPAELNYRW